jgi:L-asparaginase II
MFYEPLLEYQRDKIVENTFYGAVCVLKNKSVIFSCGKDPVIYARSLFKPFYTRSYSKTLSALSDVQKAISLSSHNGSKKHVTAAKSLLSEDSHGLLQTPVSQALLTESGEAQNHPKASKWVHNSSGHHAGLIRALLDSGVCEVRDYTFKKHLIFSNFTKELQKLYGKDYKIKKFTEDGDGLLTPAVSVTEIAKAFEHLRQVRDEDWIWEAFSKEPYYIGGEARLDSEINRLGKGELMAKEGADGLLAVSSVKGFSFVIKMAHGWDPKPTRCIAKQILSAFGYHLDEVRAPSKQCVKISHKIKSFRGF